MMRFLFIVIFGFALSGCFFFGETTDVPEAKHFKTTRPVRAKVKTKAAPRQKPGEVGEGKWREIRSSDPELTQEQQEAIEELEAIGYVDGNREVVPTRMLTVNDPRAYSGYNFYVSGHSSEVFLVGMEGEPIHKWQYQFWNAWPTYPVRIGAKGTNHFRRAYLYQNGDILAIFEGRGIIKVNKDSELLWAYPGRAHHDLEVLEDGTVYVLTREARMIRRIDPRRPVMEDSITILSPSGVGLKRISLIKCFENSEYDQIWKRGNYPSNDIFHTNTLEVLDGRIADKLPAFRKGNVLTSMRALNAIAVVDVEEEKVVWAHKGDFKLQHDPKILENGNLLLFDNVAEAGGSRVIELDPVTMEAVWEYAGDAKHPFHSETLGAAQRLPNGNTLISESDGGRALEVTPEKEIVWEFYNPHRAGPDDQYIAALFEVIRLPPDFPIDWASPPVAPKKQAP